MYWVQVMGTCIEKQYRSSVDSCLVAWMNSAIGAPRLDAGRLSALFVR